MKETNDLHELEIKFASLESTINAFMENTQEHRKNVNTKLDCINEKLTKLPCDERKAVITGIRMHLKLIYGLIITVITGIIGWAIKK